MISHRQKWELKDAPASEPVEAVRHDGEQPGKAAEHDPQQPQKIGVLPIAELPDIGLKIGAQRADVGADLDQCLPCVGGDLFEDCDAPVKIMKFAHRPAPPAFARAGLGGILRSVINRLTFAADDQRRRRPRRGGAVSPRPYQNSVAGATAAGVARRSL